MRIAPSLLSRVFSGLIALMHRTIIPPYVPTCDFIHMPPSQAIQFAQFIVTSQVFHTTKLCAALVNLKPIVPGHSLVIPKRVVPQFADLSREEVRRQLSCFNL